TVLKCAVALMALNSGRGSDLTNHVTRSDTPGIVAAAVFLPLAVARWSAGPIIILMLRSPRTGRGLFFHEHRAFRAECAGPSRRRGLVHRTPGPARDPFAQCGPVYAFPGGRIRASGRRTL